MGCSQVEGATLRRLSEDCALAISDLETQVRQYGERLVLLGRWCSPLPPDIRLWGARLAPEAIRFQRVFFCGTAGRSSCQSWLYHDSRSFGPGLFAASPSRTGIEEAPEPKGAITHKSIKKFERSFL